MEKLVSGIHPFEYVRQFMVAGDQSVDGSDPSLVPLYGKLIAEEYAEFMHGVFNNDDVEQIDAVADLIWVLAGYAHAKGWNLIGAFEEVARSNMSKVDAESGKLLKRADGKVLKPSTFSEPVLAPFVKNQGTMPEYHNIVMGLGEE